MAHAVGRNLLLVLALVAVSCQSDSSALEGAIAEQQVLIASQDAQIAAQGEQVDSLRSQVDEVASLQSQLEEVKSQLAALQPQRESNPTAITDAKAAATFIMIGPNCESTGSGVFVSPNLVLTSRHVVDVEDQQLTVMIGGPDDGPAETAFRAELVEYHPFFDLAVIRITGGREVRDDPSMCSTETPMPNVDVQFLDVEAQPLKIGDRVDALGYNYMSSKILGSADGAVDFPTVSFSSGSVVAFEPWWGCERWEGPPEDTASCSANGDLAKAVMLTDAFNASGGSGGPLVANGKVVGISDSIVGPQEGKDETGRPVSATSTTHFHEWLGRLIEAEG